MAPEQEYPGEDVGESLKHNDSLVPGSGSCFGRFHSRKVPCQIGEEKDEDEESKIGVGPHRIDLVVELILSDPRGVAKKIVGEKRLGGSNFLEEAITAEEERGDLKERISLLILVFDSFRSSGDT